MYMRLRALAAALTLAVAAPAQAASLDAAPAPALQPAPAPATPASPWRFQLTPYVWFTSLKGSIRTPAVPQTFRIEQSFSDLWSELDGALFLSGSARRDRFVLLGDFTWTSISNDGTVSVPVAPGASLGVDFDVRERQTSATLLAGYRIVEEANLGIELLGGARAWRVRTEVEAAVPPLGIDLSERQTETWVDPIIAARLNGTLTPVLSAILYGDYGGFGVGSESTWQVWGTLNYRITEAFTASAGYRHLTYDYRGGGIRTDITLRGPLIGVTWQF
jgi:hypothetical protein